MKFRDWHKPGKLQGPMDNGGASVGANYPNASDKPDAILLTLRKITVEGDQMMDVHLTCGEAKFIADRIYERLDIEPSRKQRT